MAKIISTAHSVLTQQQINEVFTLFGDRLGAELIRESALRAMNMVASNKTKIQIAQIN